MNDYLIEKYLIENKNKFKFPNINESKNRVLADKYINEVIDFMFKYAGNWDIFLKENNEEHFIMETKVKGKNIWIYGVHDTKSGAVDFEGPYEKARIKNIMRGY